MGRKKQYDDLEHERARDRVRKFRSLKKIRERNPAVGNPAIGNLAPVESKRQESLWGVEMDIQRLQRKMNERVAAKANIINEFAAAVKPIIAEIVGKDSKKYTEMMSVVQRTVEGLREQFKPVRDPELVDLEKRVLLKLEAVLDRMGEDGS